MESTRLRGTAFALTASALGCTTVTPVQGPDQTEQLVIRCGGSQVECIERAHQECRFGFDILDQEKSTAVAGGAYITSATSTEMRIKCKSEPGGEPLPEDRGALEAPPENAVGYRLGRGVKLAMVECAEQGHAWKESSSGGSCEGLPQESGIPKGHVEIRACGDRVCGVSIVAPVDDESKDVLHAFDELRSRLQDRYGGPSQDVRERPLSCNRGFLVGCLRTGRAHWASEWRWESGEAITLEIAPHGEGLALVVKYGARGAAPGRPERGL